MRLSHFGWTRTEQSDEAKIKAEAGPVISALNELGMGLSGNEKDIWTVLQHSKESPATYKDDDGVTRRSQPTDG